MLLPVFRRSHQCPAIKAAVLKNFAIFTGKLLCFSLFLINFIKKIFQHKCFPVNFAKFLRTTILKNIYERVLHRLGIKYEKYSSDYVEYSYYSHIHNFVKHLKWSVLQFQKYSVLDV